MVTPVRTLFISFRQGSRLFLQLPFTLDRFAPAVRTRMYARNSLFVDCMMCERVAAAASSASLHRRSRHLTLPACLVPSVALMSSLQLWHALPPNCSILICFPVRNTHPLSEVVYLHCQRCHVLLLCHAHGSVVLWLRAAAAHADVQCRHMR